MARIGSVTTAIRLLHRVLATGCFDRNQLARRLVLTASALDGYLAAEEAMPLDRQLCLAALVIEKVPALARTGYQLRAQVSAAMIYELHATTTHLIAPPNRFR